MKKYIAPTSKFINLASEGSLLTESNPDENISIDGTTPIDGSSIDSNRRRTNIWGEEY